MFFVFKTLLNGQNAGKNNKYFSFITVFFKIYCKTFKNVVQCMLSHYIYFSAFKMKNAGVNIAE